MEKILGRSREELIGKKIKEVSTTSPETATVVFDRTVELLKSGTPQKFTVQVSKNLNWIEFSMYSITQNEYATIVRDISDQVRLSKELEEHNIQLSEKNKEIEHFAYIASHDLQEPLSTMNNMLTMLQEDKADEIKPLERYFYFFEQSIARMKALVAGLLDYSRLGQKKELLKINVHTLLNDIRSDLSARIESSNGTLNIDSMPTIWGYRVELRLLFQNLISNAFKFMKPNEIPEISITVEDRKLDWLFKVKDNGIGIKEQNLEKIFVIFQRLNAEDAYEGTGIGLAHCKKIVELHRGQIWVESKYGEGSTFNFTIHKNLKADHEKKT